MSYDREAAFYLDAESITAEGDFVSARVLIDYLIDLDSLGLGHLPRSTLMRQLFDCREEKIAVVEFASYSQNMGQGEVRHSHKIDQPQFSTFPEGDPGKAYLRFVCSLKPVN